jgi:ribosomal protein L37AE/L43A
MTNNDNDFKNEPHQCDFCGKEMFEGDYKTLSSGIEQCNACFSTAIDTKEEYKLFKKIIIHNIVNVMNSFFGIKINIKTTLIFFLNAKSLSRLVCYKLKITNRYDPRPLAFAFRFLGVFTFLFFEEGTPLENAVINAVHELTHIWQFKNWKIVKLVMKHGDNWKILLEGLATWSEIQFLYFLEDGKYVNKAKLYEEIYSNMDNEYGWGLNNYMRLYPFVEKPELMTKTPFNKEPWPDNVPIEKITNTQ